MIAVAFAVASPLLGVFRLWRGKHEEDARHASRVRFLKRTLTVLLAILLSLLLLAGVLKGLIALNILNIKNVLGAVSVELPKDGNGYTNFLLLGKGDDDHDGIDLTDTMMVTSIDPKTNSAVMLSVPRDLYVRSANMGQGRINTLYRDRKSRLRWEGMAKEEASQLALRELMDEVGSKLDVEIHHAVIVNFTGFVQAVDALGGIEVEVPYDIVDTQYPGPNWTYETFRITAGPAHLDGETALKYARSRHTTSDFGRSARQQQIIQALGERAKTIGIIRSPRKVVALLQILSANVETTMTGQELLGAAKMGEELDRSRLVSMQLKDGNPSYTNFAQPGGFLYTPPREQFGGAAVLLPVPARDGDTDGWGQIRAFTKLLLQARTLYLSHPRVVVLNAGARTGLASRLAGELIAYGFDVQDVGNASMPKQDVSLVAPLTDVDRPAAAFFSTLLDLPLEEAPMTLPLEDRDQVTIILGKTYAFTPFETLLKQTAASSSSSL